jgi:hypothetical protein
MKMEKFTKGGWQIMPIEDDKEYIRIRGTVLGGRFKIANICRPKFYHETTDSLCLRENEESIANANLIAAAPEMYEVLKKLVAHYNFSEYCKNEIDMVLAKAGGEK